MSYRVSEAVRNQVVCLIGEGKSIKESCEILGLGDHYRTIQNNLKAHGIYSQNSIISKRKIKSENMDRIIQLYCEEKMTLQAIGDMYNVAQNTIAAWLKEANIELRPMYESKKKHSIDSHYFENIDNCSKSYVLGFMAADGYTTDKTTFGMGLKASDIDVLYFLKEQLKLSNKIKVDTTTVNGVLHSKAVLAVESKPVSDQLKMLGIVPRKTFCLDPSKILAKASIQPNSKLEYAFLLGYFDGDGGISHYVPSEETKRTKHYCEMFSLSVCGTKETCLYYQNFANGIGKLRQRFPERGVNNWTYTIGGRNQCKKLLDRLYSVKDEIGFCLQRKYELYKML